MEPEAFAARRREEFVRVDRELFPSTERALAAYLADEDSWTKDLIDDASVLWLEVFQAESPNADPDTFLARFRESIGESLKQTKQPEGSVEDSQVERVARWLGTYLVNDATFQAAGARGMRAKRWTTMHDGDVRETHVVADGQIRALGAPFDVGGFNLRFPGDPVGPPEIWINCRCVVQAAARRGALNVSDTTFALADEDLEDEEMPPDELEDDEEELTEIPVHGVLAPEGVPTGDGRQFAINSLTHRELPLPIAYQLLSGEGHSGSATVGRIDEVFRDGNELRFRGALMLNRQYTAEVIEGIIDGTVRGVSVDVDNVVVGSMSDDDGMGAGLVEFSEARVAGVTIVPIPAFQEAFISLGHEFLADLPEEAKQAIAAAADCDCEPEDEEENDDIVLAYDAFRNYTAEERRDMAKNGQALPDGSFPIKDEEDLRNAIQAIGRASDPAAAKAHIRKRARVLGKSDLIPEDWSGEVVVAAGFAPGTHDGPGWITHPIPTARIRRYWVRGKGAAKIKWGVPGDFNRCRRQLAKYVQNPQWLAGLCANMHKEALGIWPGMETGRHALVASGTPAPIFNLVASANYVFDSALFERPVLDNPRVGVVVEGDRVYGYIAQWGVCHIGISGVCTEPPSSMSNYWYYATGVVDTDKGEVRVGSITMDTGHASLKSNAKVAAAHYDNTGAVAADVAVGEDAFGIWFSGVLRGKVTDEMRHALRASGRVSGDWRWIGGQLELIAALAVNVPGYPIPKTLVASADGHQTALIAAGIVMPDEKGPSTFSADDVAGIVRATVQELRHAEKRTERATPLRETLRTKRIEALRTKIKEK